MHRIVFALGVLAITAESEPVSSRCASAFDQFRDGGTRAPLQTCEARIKEQRFVDSYNKLVLVLDDFGKTYKAKHVIDVKSVESIKNAYRELERADPWFKTEPTR